MSSQFKRSAAVLFLVLASLCAAPYAYADTVTTFGVSGTATNISGGSLGPCANGDSCSFSGTLTVDVTSGAATATDITFPGLSAFDVLGVSGPFSTSDWGIFVTNSDGALLVFNFTTSHTPGSLVGFTGGTIVPGGVGSGSTPLYTITGGIITPEPEPEPGSLSLLLFGVAALLLTRKRIGQGLPLAS